MTLRTATILTVCGLLALSGCDKNPLGTVDSGGRAPGITGVVLIPAAVAIDTIAPVNGVYTVSATLTARVSDFNGLADIRTVQADIVDPSGNHIAVVSLHDDGTSPDSAAGDGVYSSRFSLPVTRAMAGRFYPYVTATDGSGLQSNAVAPSILVFRKNSPPKLGALVAPDTLVVPATGTTLLFMTLAVSDPDGPADIREVWFTSPDATTNSTYHYVMRDDGSVTPPYSGDVEAGDGIYSIAINIGSSATKGRFRFVFQARDASGDTSASLTHYITVM